LVFSNLAWWYYKSDQFNESLNYARKSYAIRTALNDASGIAHLDLNISKIFLGTAKYDSANFYAQSALQRSKKLHLVNDIRDSYETLTLINEQIKNYPLALEYAKLFAEWKDSVNNIEKNKLVEQELQKIKFDSLQHFKKAYTKLELSKNKSQIVFFILASILLVILLGGLLVYINLKKRHQELLTLLPIESTNRTKHYLSRLEDEKEKIQEKNKALIQDKEELESHLKKQQSADIQNLRDLINSDKLHSDSYWNEFLLIFSRLYPDFFKIIKSTYPDLTQHELRICALIKLNHSVLETAKVLNITVDSARKARYRLYKKMGLNNDQELVDVIIQS
jgi:DNA-binding CsgD family transcriptional regulator